jgi:hypothetical protein
MNSTLSAAGIGSSMPNISYDNLPRRIGNFGRSAISQHVEKTSILQAMMAASKALLKTQ